MVVEAGMFNNKGTSLLRTQDEGTLAALEHGEGHPMVRQCKYARSGLSSYSYKSTYATPEAPS